MEAIASTLLKVLIKMPPPLPRFLLGALEVELPELFDAIQQAKRQMVPWLSTEETRRSTMTGNFMDGPRFAAVLITAETDSGQLICWPSFMIDRLPLHDLGLLETSLADWLDIVRRQRRLLTTIPKKAPYIEPIQTKGEEDLL